MALLCFLLDLPRLPPRLLGDLKQCLLQVANLYAISAGGVERKLEFLADRIGLCYVHKNRVADSDELKFAYIPRRNFSLRDFHHAVCNLPTDGFSLESAECGADRSGDQDKIFGRLLSKEALYSWGSKDVLRKVIFISSCLIQNVDPFQKILMDASEKCVSVEFVLLEQDSTQLEDMLENVKKFSNNISNLENCFLRRCFPVDTWVLCGLAKKWVQEVKDEGEDPRRAVFAFKSELKGSINKLYCNLLASTNQILDGFNPCQACRCHGLPIADSNKIKGSASCSVSSLELGINDLVENAVRIGEHTILFLPSFQCCPPLPPVSPLIMFNVLERTSLGSLSEGLMLGTSYVVTPLLCHDVESTSDENDDINLNDQFFHGLSKSLHALDQGLVCSSNCNMETMREANFQCFYILQPSDKGPMLLRRLAGAEETSLVLDTIQLMNCSMPKEIQESVEAFLSKVELREYNPLFHERGLHPRLNCLVKESLHFGSIPRSSKVQPREAHVHGKSSEEISPMPLTLGEKNTSAFVTKEWEQLIVQEVCHGSSPTCLSTPRLINPIFSLTSDSKPLDEKTSRILERLEAPKQQKMKGSSPLPLIDANREIFGSTKKPLVPFGQNQPTEQGMSLTQPMRPVFQKQKRKLR